MSAHRSETFPFDGDIVILDEVRRERRPVKRSSALSRAQQNFDAVVVDLVSDSDDEPLDGSTNEPVIPEMSFDDALASILQVLPEIDPKYVQEQFEKLPKGPDMIALLLSQILEEPYPRINRKRSAAAAELEEKPVDSDYSSINRPFPGFNYRRIAYDVLSSKFRTIPTATIRQAMHARNQLYAPSFIYLHTLPRENYNRVKKARNPKPTIEIDLQTPAGREVASEIAWIESWLERLAVEEERKQREKQEEEDAEAARQLNYEEHEENGGLLECGCCFDESPANFMTSCSEGHLFCLQCAKQNAETTVGNGGYTFKCMDMSGCKAEFAENEIARFVDPKTIALRDKLESGDAMRVASIEGFVSCPFCDYGAIVEDENDKEFRCQNKDCKIVSCRLCRAESHIPLSCEEHQKENKLSAKHIVEEAMSAALIQVCNKCSKPFVKLSGCNKMTCTCGNLQCYVCGESVKDYHHFDTPRKDGKKCPLHENDSQRLDTKIKKAKEDAVKKVLEEGEGLNEEDLKVDIPEEVNPNRDRQGGLFGMAFRVDAQNWGVPYHINPPWGFNNQPQNAQHINPPGQFQHAPRAQPHVQQNLPQGPARLQHQYYQNQPPPPIQHPYPPVFHRRW